MTFTKNFTAWFADEDGNPLTGASPTITIINVATGVVVANAGAMTELSLGFYKYAFTMYDPALAYAALADAHVDMSGRYAPAISQQDPTEALQFIIDVEGGTWAIDVPAKQWVHFKADGVTEIARFNLFDSAGNPATENIYLRERV